MKRLTEGYIPQKSAVLTEDEISNIFEKLDNNDPGHLLATIGIVLIYYCLLRCKEVLFLQVKDIVVVYNAEVIAQFPYATKTRERGFEYYVSKKLEGYFRKYIGKLTEKKGLYAHFLENWNMSSEKRHQNTGSKAVNCWINLIGYLSNKDVSGLSTHIL